MAKGFFITAAASALLFSWSAPVFSDIAVRIYYEGVTPVLRVTNRNSYRIACSFQIYYKGTSYGRSISGVKSNNEDYYGGYNNFIGANMFRDFPISYSGIQVISADADVDCRKSDI